jgi:hypothetical protein
MKEPQEKRPIDILMTIAKVAAIILLIAMGLFYLLIKVGMDHK